jgi:hypothetical protein
MTIDYKNEIEFDRAVLFILHQHKGLENAIKRWDLVERVFGKDAVIEPLRNNNNAYDRQVRDSIERWRSQGQHICNIGDGGYFIANSREEFEKFKEYYLSAAYRKLSNMAMMDVTADKRFGVKAKNVSPLQVSLL